VKRTLAEPFSTGVVIGTNVVALGGTMKVWLIQHGEYLPTQEGTRPMRMAMLGRALVAQGHSVLWWSSTFSHLGRSLVYSEDRQIELSSGFVWTGLHAGAYENNISLDRYRHHRRLTRRFRSLAALHLPPDAIVAAFPIPDLALAAVNYARARNVPCIVDVLDLWPEVFLERVGRPLRGIAKVLLTPWYRTASAALREADCLVACSQGYLDWALHLARRTPSAQERVFYLSCADDGAVCTRPESQRILDLRKRLLGKIVFTYLGSFGYAYDLALVCEAARRFGESTIANVHFVLAGGGQRYESLCKYAGSLSTVTLTGWLNGDETRALLDMSDVGLIPRSGTLNNLPNKAFEYMAAGLPILSSLEGEMVDIIRQYNIGFSYAFNSLDEFCSYVMRLAENPVMRSDQGANAKRLFAERFQQAVIYDGYARHVAHVVAKKTGLVVDR
jgi:glycosyltransferase involved in cell wall biosynthesis